MHQPSKIIKTTDASLHYQILGSGPEVLLAFHGFGQTLDAFSPYAEALGDHFTIYSFDLFFHGKSFWHHRETPMKKAQWKELLQQLLEKEEIRQFGIMGYSMGGKFALSTLEAFPERITRILLIAPDGVKTLFWYSLATYPSWLRKYFRGMIVKPENFYRLLKTLRKIRLLDKSVVKFAKHQMNTRKKRRRVYYSWVVFRHLSFSMKKIGQLVREQHIPLTLFIGSYDRIITEKNMEGLLQEVPEHHLIVLPKGHNTLIADSAEYLKKHKEYLG